MQEAWVQSLGGEDPLEEEMATHSVFLAGKSHGQRSLVGHSPWGGKELDTTEHTTLLEYILPLNARGQKDDIVFLSFQRQKNRRAII